MECAAPLARRCPAWGAAAPPAAKFCPECAAPLEAAGRSAAASEPESGERRQLTVLFCDLVGSTELSSRLDPEEWQGVLRRYQEAAAAVLAPFGGHVAQLLGDGLLVYFGWPEAHGDDAERAVRAGLGLVDALKELTDLPVPLAVRIGIHTGPVVVGQLGGGARRETLALGETTNLAARLQGMAVPDTVVLSDATLRLVAGIFVTEDLGPQRLKGIAAPVQAHRAVQPTGVRSRLELDPQRLTRFVGREMELGTLVDRWERALEGEGQNVLIVAEPGVGKSRLVYELREKLAGSPHGWLESRGTPYTTGTPFHPVIELVRQGLAIGPEEKDDEKVRKIERALTLTQLGADDAVPLIADFLGLPAPAGHPPLALSPDGKRRRTLELLTAWTLALAELQPLVLLAEDLHWQDPSSLELLGRLIAQSARTRLLLVGTARPEFTPPWPARSNLTTVALTRLTKRQARELVGTLGATLPPDMVDALVARADGVPLYLEELSKAVTEPGVAREVEAIPATLADSLMARLDRLSAAKEVAQRASVLGREFPYALLAAVANMDEAALRHGLARLADAEILFARGEPPDATYTFKHALVQEAAYTSLLKRTRQQLHARVVDVLVSQFPERVASEPELVARHAEAAGRTDDAVAYLERAGAHAQARSAHEEAIAHLRHAIALVAALPESAERNRREAALQLALAGSLRPARGISHAETETTYERARVVSELAGDTRRLGLALGGLASFYSNAGKPERGAELAARVLALAEQSGDAELALLGNVELGVAEVWQAKFASSVGHLDAGLGLYQAGRGPAARNGGPDVMPLSYLDLGVIALVMGSWSLPPLGWPDRALARAREGVALARQLGDPFNLAYALAGQAIVHTSRREPAAQRERAEEAIAVSEAHGFALFLGLGRFYRAAARAAEGEPGAVADMLAALATAATTGTQAGAPALLSNLAETQMAVGQLAEARGMVDAGLALSLQTGQPGSDSVLHRLRGELELAMAAGEHPGPDAEAAAEEHFHRALDVARAQEAKSLELRAATSLARLWQAQGKPGAARDLLAPVYAWFSEGFDTLDLVEAKALLEELGA
jgi:class 3 adenylate cyclase/tetratricopeptide (TPR) repeat protein